MISRLMLNLHRSAAYRTGLLTTDFSCIVSGPLVFHAPVAVASCEPEASEFATLHEGDNLTDISERIPVGKDDEEVRER